VSEITLSCFDSAIARRASSAGRPTLVLCRSGCGACRLVASSSRCRWPGRSRAQRRFPRVLTRPRRETCAVRPTVPPSAERAARIDRLLAVGLGEDPRGALSELARLGMRLIIQRAVEDEFDAWLGRARYERRSETAPGKRNGYRPRAGCRPPRASVGSRSRRCRRPPSRSSSSGFRAASSCCAASRSRRWSSVRDFLDQRTRRSLRGRFGESCLAHGDTSRAGATPVSAA
jgi:hypothetical protein